jgi:hypothetical protein
MLGRKHTENKLRSHGAKTAPARIIAVKQGHIGMGGGQDFGGQNSTLDYHLTLEVSPEGEVPFEAKVTDRLLISNGPPAVDSPVTVLFDPDDHSKLSIDHSSSAMVANFAADIPQGMTDAVQAAGAGDLMADMMKQASEDPLALARKFSGKNADASIAEIRAKYGGGAPGGVIYAGGAPAQAAPDPVAQLASLADLRDRGVLSDEEFNTQKKRILGE